jgi:hypothetical protein
MWHGVQLKISKKNQVTTAQYVTATQVTNMKFVSLCEQYQEAFGAKDLAAVQELFTEEAVISAPVSGTANVRDFHTYLYSITKKAAVRFPNVIRSRESPPTLSMQFSYTFAIETGQVGVLDGVATFEIDASVKKFKKLTVAYDPLEVRQLMMEAGIAPPATSVPAINAS